MLRKGFVILNEKMILAVIVAFVAIGSVYCKSLPQQPQLTDMNVQSFNAFAVPVTLIRKGRQSGKY